MDVILHLGAHRCATTSFQAYLRDHRAALAARGIGIWDPRRTRNGLLHNVTARDAQARDRGRVRLALEAEVAQGRSTVLVSDENMIGTPRACLREGCLYPAAGERLARLGAAFGPVARAVLQVRAQDAFWASLWAYAVARGMALPDPAELARILERSARSWRGVVSDIACALPRASIVVTPFERFADRPDALLARTAGLADPPPARPGTYWAHRAPDLPALRRAVLARGGDPRTLAGDGRWRPFPPEAAALLREMWLDDLYWLRAGAGGLAAYVECPEAEETGLNRPPSDDRRGQDDERDQGRVAGAG
ncbi:hypothetical protein [Roseivivax isoporae]|uniref:Sulfotransferase domain-containing protein n=1 Tax=Roseivivax isoporae LMG 25204 TaxID=1449351 RepID=X7F9I3_9RHOB|nr:hypothetical protein [Roseivivax isoporae]ETX29522.1 hypothetical protein RISW2_23585 [Roseivivax isoporae LMG 25204]